MRRNKVGLFLMELVQKDDLTLLQSWSKDLFDISRFPSFQMSP